MTTSVDFKQGFSPETEQGRQALRGMGPAKLHALRTRAGSTQVLKRLTGGPAALVCLVLAFGVQFVAAVVQAYLPDAGVVGAGAVLTAFLLTVACAVWALASGDEFAQGLEAATPAQQAAVRMLSRDHPATVAPYVAHVLAGRELLQVDLAAVAHLAEGAKA